MITAAVLASQGEGLRLELIIPVAAAGAICGDNVSYWVGRLAGERIADKLFSGKRRKLLDRAHRLLEERGGYLIVIGRFIPGGRTAVTFAAGSLDWRVASLHQVRHPRRDRLGDLRVAARVHRREELREEHVEGLLAASPAQR